MGIQDGFGFYVVLLYNEGIFFGGGEGGGGVCLVLERSGLETVSGTLRQIQKKALLRQTMISKFKVQLELLSSPIKLFL